MTDLDKAFGQAVKQEPADKLYSADGDQLGTVLLSVFGRKSPLNTSIFSFSPDTLGFCSLN